MLVPATAPLLPNGETPVSNNQILRSQAYLFAINSAADSAKSAVLGVCHPPLAPADVAITSSNPIVAWIQSNPCLAIALGIGGLVVFSKRSKKR